MKNLLLTLKKEKKFIILSLEGLVIGIIFGFAIQRCNVYLPFVIKEQMSFSNFTMLKMFLTFYIVSSLSVLFLNYFSFVQLIPLPIIHYRNLIGGFILGFGLNLIGSCPGTVFAQIPEIKSRIFSLFGGIFGGILYGFINNDVEKLFPKQNKKISTIYQYFNVPLFSITIPLVIFNILILLLIEYYYPFKPKYINFQEYIGFNSYIWSPYLTGLILGLLQIPSFIISNGIGASSAYVTVGSLFLKKIGYTNEYFKSYLIPPKSVFEPFFNIGIIVGAYFSSQSNHNTIPDEYSLYHCILNFIGGLIIIFGARFANQCTSGSISGMSKTDIGSFITCFGIFGGGILSSYIANNINIFK